MRIIKPKVTIGVLTVREGERVLRRNSKRVRFHLPGDECASSSSSSSSTSKLIPAPLNLQPRPTASPQSHDCRNESPTHRCMTAQLVDYPRPDSDTLPEPPNIVVNSNGKVGSLWNYTDDIWMQMLGNKVPPCPRSSLCK